MELLDNVSIHCTRASHSENESEDKKVKEEGDGDEEGKEMITVKATVDTWSDTMNLRDDDGSEVIDALGRQDPTDQLSHGIDGNSKEWEIWG